MVPQGRDAAFDNQHLIATLPQCLHPIPALDTGPALAARYLVPALVDCMGRLAVTAASAASALALSSVRIRPRPPPKNTTTTAEPPDSSNADGSTHVKLVEGSGRVGKEDPASRALLRYCHSRKGIGGDPDAGIGKGSTFLVLSRALGDICSRVRTGGMVLREAEAVPICVRRHNSNASWALGLNRACYCILL